MWTKPQRCDEAGGGRCAASGRLGDNAGVRRPPQGGDRGSDRCQVDQRESRRCPGRHHWVRTAPRTSASHLTRGHVAIWVRAQRDLALISYASHAISYASHAKCAGEDANGCCCRRTGDSRACGLLFRRACEPASAGEPAERRGHSIPLPPHRGCCERCLIHQGRSRR